MLCCPLALIGLFQIAKTKPLGATGAELMKYGRDHQTPDKEDLYCVVRFEKDRLCVIEADTKVPELADKPLCRYRLYPDCRAYFSKIQAPLHGFPRSDWPRSAHRASAKTDRLSDGNCLDVDRPRTGEGFSDIRAANAPETSPSRFSAQHTYPKRQ